MLTLDLPDEAATAALGATLAEVLRPFARRSFHFVALHGDLGAGKTTLARGLLRALGYGGRVPSPTYTLVEPYDFNGFTVLHVDLYRLTEEGELEYLGLRDWPQSTGFALIEWPDRSARIEADAALHVALERQDGGRRVRLWGDPRLIAAIRRQQRLPVER